MKLGVTGIGIVPPLGTGKETNWKRLINSESAVKYNKILDIHSACVNDFDMQESERQYEMAKAPFLEAVSDANSNNSDFDRKNRIMSWRKQNQSF
jgi:3-oxoacyl-(acyl-carrier-protein) synthase